MMKRTIALFAISLVSILNAPSIEGRQPNPSIAISLASQPQTLNPPYLSEMPTAEKVMSAMKVADPRESALRQIGTFYQLIEIIKTLSGPREFRGFTPDEARIVAAYGLAQYNVEQAADKAFPSPAGRTHRFTEQTPYRYGRWDRRFGVEGIQTFQTFFSAVLKAEFDKIIQGDNARRAARAQAYQNNPPAAQQTQPATQGSSVVKPGSQEELRRCIASGRSERTCFTEVLGNGMDQLSGISTKPVSPQGLRMTG